MGRTARRRARHADDPQQRDRLKEDLGLFRLFMDEWYGFNAAREIPARGTLDPEGDDFVGIPANRLKALDITAAEQADNSTNNRILAPDAVLNANIGEQINASKLPNLNGLNGQLSGSRIEGNIDVSNLPLNIPAANVPHLQNLNGTLPLGRTEGKLGAGRINWNKNSVPKFAISGVNWEDVDNKPPLASKNYVDNAKDDLKKWANNKFSQKGHNHA